MLTPDYLYRITEGAEDIASQLHANIMQKIIERMMIRIGRGEDYLLTATDRWQIDVLQDAGYLLSDIQKEIADKTSLQEKEIQEAMEDAGVITLQWDDKIYQDAGLSPTPLTQSPNLVRILERNYRATNAEWRNFTRTTALDSQRLFINQMDRAYNMVVSGAVSYTEAVRDVIDNITETGVKVKYPTGREISIEAATMMIVRTGVSQAAAEVTMQRMRDMKWGIVLVSSHIGARNKGTIPENHELWQGQFYSLPEYDNTFPDFYYQTGYGTAVGLCGVGCRHSFGPGDGENNPFEEYDTEENRRVYEMQQRQRLLERRIRDSKRTIQNLQTAIDNSGDERLKYELQNQLDRKAYTLKRQNKEYQQYCESNGLKEYAERLKVAKWDRRQAAKAAGAARRYQNAKGE